MRLFLAAAIGRGNTELGAFDAALVGTGVANFNVIRLSSMIPPHSEISPVAQCPLGEDSSWGDRLYAVYADRRTSIPGAQVWAGVGWCQNRVTGQGIFVEHGGCREQDVRDQIAASLGDLRATRKLEFGPMNARVIGAMCSGAPTCALVICSYGSEPWPTRRADCRAGERQESGEHEWDLQAMTSPIAEPAGSRSPG